MTSPCEECAYRDYDEDGGLLCNAELDEDEMERFLRAAGSCPFYRRGDDYETARRQ